MSQPPEITSLELSLLRTFGETLAERGATTPARGPFLDCVRRALGGRRAAWCLAGPNGWRLASARPTLRRPAAAIDWGLVASLEPGAARELGAAELARGIRTRAGVCTRLTLFASEGRARPSSVLWLEDSELAWEQLEPAGLELVQALARLELERERSARHTHEAHLADIGRRAAALGHDLRNEVTLARLQLERLASGGPPQGTNPSQTQTSLSSELRATLERAAGLCQSTLRGDAPERRRFDLSALLNRELERARLLAAREELEVELVTPPGLWVFGDPMALGRLLRNLLLNALAACFDEGQVTLEARREGADVRLTVADRGAGMAAQRLPRLFAAGHSGRASTGHGTTSVIECARELGASLRVESESGSGTRVELELPGWGVSEGARDLLLLDTDPLHRRALAKELRARGLSTWEAPDARTALSLSSFATVGALVVPRGAGGRGSGWPELLRLCAARDMPVWTTSCLEGGFGSSAAALARRAHGERASGSEATPSQGTRSLGR